MLPRVRRRALFEANVTLEVEARGNLLRGPYSGIDRR